jgi:hypothetical protein
MMTGTVKKMADKKRKRAAKKLETPRLEDC